MLAQSHTNSCDRTELTVSKFTGIDGFFSRSLSGTLAIYPGYYVQKKGVCECSVHKTLIPVVSGGNVYLGEMHKKLIQCSTMVQQEVQFCTLIVIYYICLFFPAQMEPRGLSPRQSKSDSDDDDLPNVTLDSVNETGSTALSIARAVQE